jgi:hypothetical protein
MAAVPGSAVVATAATSTALTTAASFVANLGISYLLSRVAAQDGPRLDNLAAASGQYGVGMPRLYGEKVRLAGIFIAQCDIKEKQHTAGSEALSIGIGVVSGAAEGFMLGGPVGAAVGAVVGGILGAAVPKQHYYTYSDTFALLLGDRLGQDPIEGIAKMWANGNVLFSGTEPVVSETLDTSGRLIKRTYGQNKYFKSLTIYGGGTDQGVDPVLAAALGEDGAYPFTAYAVIEDLQLAQWGNSVPTVETLINVATGETLATLAETICSAASIDPLRNLSSSALADKLVRGYALTDVANCWDALKPLLPAFGVDAAEVTGQIRFMRRGQSLRSAIPLEDMGAYEDGNTPPDLFTFTRSTDLDLPKETDLTFIDPAKDYQPNTASSVRDEGKASSNITVTLPLVLTADEGASAAALMHWDAWLGRTQLKSTLTDAWLGLETGLSYAVPFNGVYVPYRITRRTRGANGIIEFEALSDEAVTYTATVTGTSGTTPDDESTEFPATRLILMDMPIFSDAHDDFGYYLAMAGDQSGWTRGQAQISSDGTNFATLIDSDSGNPAMGDVTGTLAAGTTTGLDDTLDTTTTLTVVLLHDGMELSSATDAQLDAWANFAYVGKSGHGEYLQFKTATKVSPRTWHLTNLRRGRKGTDYAIGTHASGEEFCLLGADGVFRVVYSDSSDWGTAFSFRGVTLHQADPTTSPVQSFTNTGEGKRPYSPIAVAGSWNASNDLTVSWEPRSRLQAGGLGIDDLNNYDVLITSGSGRTITVTSSASGVYSAAQQTTDGVTPGSSVSGKVRQLSDVNDGRWRSFTLTVPGTGAPTTPATPSVTPVSGANLLGWNANPVGDAVTAYNVYRADGEGASFGSSAMIGSTAGTGYSDSSADASADYTYFVVAVNGSGSTSSAGSNIGAGQASAAASLVASATMTAPLIVNIFSASGAAKARPADVADDSKPADGFILQGAASGSPVAVFGRGAIVTSLSGLTPGANYWLAAGGTLTATVPSSGWRQFVGKALSATTLRFDPDQGTLL